MPDPEALVRRIQSLPPEQIAEVEDFVDFLSARQADRAVVRGFAVASAPSFASIWDNPDDAIYDAP